jgi:TonB family protein
MSVPTALWKKWEGRVADGKFPLRQWLGGSDQSAVFLTERAGDATQKAVVKLIAADGPDGEQLSRWADAARLAHPHLLRLFERGRCQIDDTQLLYVVMEYAEENLAEILPLRPLAPAEAAEMLRPTAEALVFLHKAGFVHARIHPSNIMAVGDQLKISGDGLRRAGERNNARALSVYDAPEVATAGPSPAADIWSLGVTLVAVLTQNEPKVNSSGPGPGSVTETIPLPFREIARQCMQVDPRQRCTVGDILSQIQPRSPVSQPTAGARMAEAHIREERPKRWIVPIVVAGLLLVALIGIKFMSHPPAIPAGETRPASAPAGTPATKTSAPFSEDRKPAQKGVVRGSVLQQVQPDVSRSAQNTITGRFKVSVQVEVDASGNVSQAKLAFPGPSAYFANHALAAARSWKFNPPQVDGEAAASEWMLRFQFSRASIQAFPSEIKP